MKTLQLLITTLLIVLVVAACTKPSNFPPEVTTVTIDSTNLPIVWIEVNGDSIMRDKRIGGFMTIIHNGEGRLNYADTIAHPGQHIDYKGYIALSHRGNSTYNTSPKKPYSLRTLAEPFKKGGKKQKVSLLGMGKDNNWALLAPYNDKSMMRDILAFELARPWMEYVPQGRYCELFLDGTYYGVHILTEVISKGPHRLNLHKPGDSGDAITGDYLMEVDCDDDVTHTSRFCPVTASGSPIRDRRILFQYKSPDYEDLDEEQRSYIEQRIDQMEAALASSNYLDPATGYRNYIDVKSFIDYQLLMEIGHNVDGYRLSGKFYKRRDSVDPRFKMVLWDMNFAFGNAKYYEGWRYDNWVYQNNELLYNEKDIYLIPFWWYKLNHDPEYTSQLKTRWAQFRNGNMSNERIMATVDSISSLLTACGAERRNSQAWPTWGKFVWPNYYVAANFEDEISYIKQWLVNRLAWMDHQLLYPTQESNGKKSVSQKVK